MPSVAAGFDGVAASIPERARAAVVAAGLDGQRERSRRGTRCCTLSSVARARSRERARRRRRERVAPLLASGGPVPARTVVGRDLDATDPAAAGVGRGAGDRDGMAGVDGGAGIGCGDRGRGWRRVGRCDGRGEAGLQRRGLHAHVGEQVDGRLPHRGARCRAAAVVGSVEAPRPLHRAGAEHERVADAVQRQRVRRGSGRVGGAVVLQVLAAPPASSRRVGSDRRAAIRCRDPRPTRSRASSRRGRSRRSSQLATFVFRQKRRFPSGSGTFIV